MHTNLLLAFFSSILLLTSCGETLAPNKPVLAERKIFSPWYERHAQALLDVDHKKNLYQLKVIPQKHNECTLHQTRNLFYAMAMLESNGQNFEKEHRRLLDSDLFEEMMLNTVCDIETQRVHPAIPRFVRQKPAKNETRTRRYPDIKLFLTENADFATYVPARSKRYAEDLIEFSRYVNNQDYKNVLEATRLKAPGIEKRVWPDHLSADLSTLTGPGHGWLRQHDPILRFYRAVEKLHVEKTAFIPIQLDLNSVGSILHAVSLLVRKAPQTNGLEFVFMDPLNWRMTTTETYQKTIDTVIRLASSPRYFRDSLIRSGYFTALKFYDDIQNMEPAFRTYAWFAYLEILENLAALDDELFVTHYKSKTCEMITRTLAGAPISVDLHPTDDTIVNYPDAKAELLRRFSCP